MDFRKGDNMIGDIRIGGPLLGGGFIGMGGGKKVGLLTGFIRV